MDTEFRRINKVYENRDSLGFRELYGWHRPETLFYEFERKLITNKSLHRRWGEDLDGLKALDVGCGDGANLRYLCEIGFSAFNLYGTEYLESRIVEAKMKSHEKMNFHVGDLDVFADGSFDVVFINTVLSSILEEKFRKSLVSEIRRVCKPKCQIFIVDFRYKKPSNAHVTAISPKHVISYFGPSFRPTVTYLHVLPPIARRLAKLSPLLFQMLGILAPFLRSHFVLSIERDQGD